MAAKTNTKSNDKITMREIREHFESNGYIVDVKKSPRESEVEVKIHNMDLIPIFLDFADVDQAQSRNAWSWKLQHAVEGARGSVMRTFFPHDDVDPGEMAERFAKSELDEIARFEKVGMAL